MTTYKLVRVIYGLPNTDPTLREYQIDGVGPVGTLKEWQEAMPKHKFIISKDIS